MAAQGSFLHTRDQSHQGLTNTQQSPYMTTSGGPMPPTISHSPAPGLDAAQMHSQQQQLNQAAMPVSSNFLRAAPSQYGASMASLGSGDRGSSEVVDRRRIRSVILGEETIGDAPQDQIRYVEVPYIEEVVRHVPRKEIVEVEKFVPKIEIEYTDRIVEVPQIQYIDKTVEIPQIQEVVRTVPRREIIEVAKEYIRHVPKIETKLVEKIVEVPGQIVEVPKPYPVNQPVYVHQHEDRDVPMVVAQTVRPMLREADDHIDVEMIQYEPEMVPVDIHVPRKVNTEITAVGIVDEQHRVVQVPPAQYNTMLRMLNPHIEEHDGSALPFVADVSGQVSFVSEHSMRNVQPVPGVDILGWTATQVFSPQSVSRRSSRPVELKTTHNATTTLRPPAPFPSMPRDTSRLVSGGQLATPRDFQSAASRSMVRNSFVGHPLQASQVMISPRVVGAAPDGSSVTSSMSTMRFSSDKIREKKKVKGGKRSRGVCPC